MKKAISILALSSLSLVALCPAHAMNLSLDVASSSESTMVYGVGLQWDFSSQWWSSQTGHLSGYWDASYRYWEGDESSGMHSVSVTPVFVYEFSGTHVKPYLEAGVGAALFSKTHYEGQRFGTAFNFASHIGAGLRFAEHHEIGLRAMHYSNASIKQPNDGIEAYSLRYRYLF